MTDDLLKDLPRLGDEALGPCAGCGKVMLGTGLPVFYRITVQHCGVDAKAIQRHVGLAQMMGGGPDGLHLAAIMGPGEKKVVELGKGAVNVCHQCAPTVTVMQIHAAALEGAA